MAASVSPKEKKMLYLKKWKWCWCEKANGSYNSFHLFLSPYCWLLFLILSSVLRRRLILRSDLPLQKILHIFIKDETFWNSININSDHLGFEHECEEALFALFCRMDTVGPWIQGLAGGTLVRFADWDCSTIVSHVVSTKEPSLTFSDNDSSPPRSWSFMCQKYLLIRFTVLSLIWHFYVFLQLIWNIDGSFFLWVFKFR